MMEVRKLHPEFGAEIRNIDFARDFSPQMADDMRAALDQYQLLLLRSASPLPPERQVEIASWLGKPVDNGGGKLWSLLQNDEAAGAVKLPFHSDLTYTDHPIEFITLYAQELPPGGTTTSFVSNVASWASLPAALQDQLHTLTARHYHDSALVPQWPEFIAYHPVCKPHPHTGAPMLFVTEHHADQILGMDPEESRALLAGLFAHIYAEEHVYTHHWQANDLLVWDNIATQHARREAADPSQGRRVVRRVVISDVAMPELVDRARAQLAERQSALT